MSVNQYKIISVSHHNLNVNELDKFVIQHQSSEELFIKLSQTKSRFEIDELMYLSTCNRILFMFYTDQEIGDDFILRLFRYINPEVDFKDEYLSFVDVYEGSKAVDHVFSVASSVDSLVIGEREILRQFRDAYKLCREAHLMGDHMRLIEKYLVQTAKAVYSETKIGNKPVSIVSLAVQKMLGFDLPENPNVLMIGAGETNTLFSKFLAKQSLGEVVIYNRSLDNAKELCNMFASATANHLSDLEKHQVSFDVMVACTASLDHIVTEEIYKSIDDSSTHKKLLIDLSVPNNIDKTIAKRHNVQIVDIEELRDLAKQNMNFRKLEVVKAKEIIKTQVEDFVHIHRQRQIEKQFSELPKEIKAIKQKAINEVYQKQIDQLDNNAKALIVEMMDYMEKKCVSIPYKMAKELN